MTNPPDQSGRPSRREAQHPGYYGAGWGDGVGVRSGWSISDRSATPGPLGSDPSPHRLLDPGFSALRLTTATLTLAGLVGIALVWACIASAGTALFGLFGMAATGTPVAWVLGGGSVWAPFALALLAPLPFYVGAFVALVFVAPVTGKRPLPVVLLRAVLAGAAGTVLLALVGVVCGSYMSAQYGNVGFLVLDVFLRPLALGTVLTATLPGFAAASWLWVGRPRRRTALGQSPQH